MKYERVSKYLRDCSFNVIFPYTRRNTQNTLFDLESTHAWKSPRFSHIKCLFFRKKLGIINRHTWHIIFKIILLYNCDL